MKIYKLLNRTKAMGLWIIILFSLSLLLIFPTECRNGAANGVFLCIQVLIPSLFPFMILSDYLSGIGFKKKKTNIFEKTIKFIFGLPGFTALPIILSMLGGYPVGAVSIKTLYNEKRITKSQGERMSMFCVGAGPGFLVTYIGAAMTRSIKTGYILLTSQIISFVLLGILARFTIHEDSELIEHYKNNCGVSPSHSLPKSIENAIKNSSVMCALVVIFGSVCEIFITLCKSNPAFIWMTSLMEITNGIKFITGFYPIPLISFVCGFGGICVHLQIFSLLRELNINKCNFYIFRIIQGILCAAITKLLLKLFPVSQSVFSTVSNPKPQLYTTTIGCIFLIFVCIAFIICIKQKKLR